LFFIFLFFFANLSLFATDNNRDLDRNIPTLLLSEDVFFGSETLERNITVFVTQEDEENLNLDLLPGTVKQQFEEADNQKTLAVISEDKKMRRRSSVSPRAASMARRRSSRKKSFLEKACGVTQNLSIEPLGKLFCEENDDCSFDFTREVSNYSSDSVFDEVSIIDLKPQVNTWDVAVQTETKVEQSFNYFEDVEDPLAEIYSFLTSTDDNDYCILSYTSKPFCKGFAIAFFLKVSEFQNCIDSIFASQKSITKKLKNLPLMIITLEKRGVSRETLNDTVFWCYYSISQILSDHKTVISFLKNNPPEGWNGKFVFIGKEEGARISLILASLYPEETIAALCWSSVGHYSWEEESWLRAHFYFEQQRTSSVKSRICFFCSSFANKKYSRDWYYAQLKNASNNPVPNQFFEGTSFYYLADAQLHLLPNYKSLTMPIFCVFSESDPVRPSFEDFIRNCAVAKVKLTCKFIPGYNCFLKPISYDCYEWLGKVLAKEFVQK